MKPIRLTLEEVEAAKAAVPASLYTGRCYGPEIVALAKLHRLTLEQARHAIQRRGHAQTSSGR